MLVSLFTPTHDVRLLKRLRKSIQRQTDKNFEWVIVPNGGVAPRDIPAKKVTQARIVPYGEASGNIGKLKSFACQHCQGDILAEVDHDDELTPDCVATLREAFQSDPETDFVYSNCCEISDGKPWRYSEDFGWEYRPFEWKGQRFYEMVSFDPSPASFSRIWYAPNHLRAWRTDFYREIGGHDEALDVLDDHDLLIRSYLHGKVRHLDKCLYVYHVHDSNTWRGPRNTAIQTGTLELYDRHIFDLVTRWAQLNRLRVVNLGESSDLTADGPLPFADGEVGLFVANDILCKLSSPQRVMNEIFRCLAPNGWLLSETPSTDGRGAFQDPRHISYWNRNSFWYYTRREHANYIGSQLEFQAVRLEDHFPTAWHEENNLPYVKAHLLKASGRVPGQHDFRQPRIATQPASRRATGSSPGRAPKHSYTFTIITPTIERLDLVRCCQSISSQTYDNWQHLLVLDGAEWDQELEKYLGHPNRELLASGKRHHDYGNYSRRLAYDSIRGDYVIYLDDDNYLLHDRVLEMLNQELDGEPWAVCPIVLAGKYFFNDPPGMGRTDLCQLVLQPTIADHPVRFPDSLEYAADGELCEYLMSLCPPQMLPQVGPIAVYESSGLGKRRKPQKRVPSNP